MWASGSSPSLTKVYIVGMVAALAGLYLPSLFIRARADRRQREIINGFPDALDLMLVCVEAGLGLEAAFSRVGMEPKQAKLRAKQIWHWIYNRGVSDIAKMTDIAKAQQPWLIERFAITRPEVVEAQVSSDGTRKWLLRTHDGHDFEMVFIPDADRGTLCVSSQVGCTLNCTFCHTGTMRLVRNLTAQEIVGQVMPHATNSRPRPSGCARRNASA